MDSKGVRFFLQTEEVCKLVYKGIKQNTHLSPASPYLSCGGHHFALLAWCFPQILFSSTARSSRLSTSASSSSREHSILRRRIFLTLRRSSGVNNILCCSCTQFLKQKTDTQKRLHNPFGLQNRFQVSDGLSRFFCLRRLVVRVPLVPPGMRA